MSLPRVLFLGPTFFKPGIWMTLARYVFGDLFRALAPHCQLFMISNPMPPHARQGKRFLAETFGMQCREIPADIDHPTRIALVARMCGEIRPDVITNVFGGGTSWGYVGSQVARLVGARSVVRVSGDEITSFLMQGDFEQGSLAHQYKMECEHAAFTAAHDIITMSPWEQRRVAAIAGDADKVHFCMRGVDLEAFSPKEDKPQSFKRFSFIGRNSEEKGYFLLDEAARIIEERMPDLRFFFAGNFEPSREGNRVYTGYIDCDKLSRYYDSVDSLILPSVTEGFPQVVCEVMAKGMPCIVSRHIFSGYLSHGENCMLVDLKPEDLVRKISMLASDPDLGAAMGRSARAFAEEHFDKNHWSEVYRRIITG